MYTCNWSTCISLLNGCLKCDSSQKSITPTDNFGLDIEIND